MIKRVLLILLMCLATSICQAKRVDLVETPDWIAWTETDEIVKYKEPPLVIVAPIMRAYKKPIRIDIAHVYSTYDVIAYYPDQNKYARIRMTWYDKNKNKWPEMYGTGEPAYIGWGDKDVRALYKYLTGYEY